jgi:hypothetical protein
MKKYMTIEAFDAILLIENGKENER